jgi:hypothetical protein
MRVVVALSILVLCACSQVPSLAPPPPTPTAVVPTYRQLPGRGFSFAGHGSAATDEIVPDYAGTLGIGVSVVTLSHTGRSTFIVTALQEGGAEVVTSVIGAYQGQRPLVVTGALAFEVTADGDWSLKVQPMSSGGAASFTGRGDLVSAFFTPPRASNWTISHDGTTFTAAAHCLGGSAIVAEHTEPFTETSRLVFPSGPCFWEVHADGLWALKPVD